MPLAMARLCVVAVFALGLSACAGSEPERSNAFSPDVGHSFVVEDIEVVLEIEDYDEDLDQSLRSQLRENLDYCAVGDVPVDVRVTIDTFEEANAALTLLIGDTAELMGFVHVHDAATGDLLGTQRVEITAGGGGLIGIAATANADERLAISFARVACVETFHKQPPPLAADDSGNPDGRTQGQSQQRQDQTGY